MNVVIENGKVFASPKGGRGRAGEPGFPAKKIEFKCIV
jgi:hypothetical protein